MAAGTQIQHGPYFAARPNPGLCALCLPALGALKHLLLALPHLQVLDILTLTPTPTPTPTSTLSPQPQP